MSKRPIDLVSDALDGWRPSPEAQQIMIWRLLHLLMSRYGSVPLGQAVVAVTAGTLNDLGLSPTVTELCEATGLPKSSISRYVSAQMEQGVLSETIDPEDRRRRKLAQTEMGRNERRWLLREMRRIIESIQQWDAGHDYGQKPVDPVAELQRMREVVASQPPEFGDEPTRARKRA